jgi:hypothetical protein
MNSPYPSLATVLPTLTTTTIIKVYPTDFPSTNATNTTSPLNITNPLNITSTSPLLNSTSLNGTSTVGTDATSDSAYDSQAWRTGGLVLACLVGAFGFAAIVGLLLYAVFFKCRCGHDAKLARRSSSMKPLYDPGLEAGSTLDGAGNSKPSSAAAGAKDLCNKFKGLCCLAVCCLPCVTCCVKDQAEAVGKDLATGNVGDIVGRFKCCVCCIKCFLPCIKRCAKQQAEEVKNDVEAIGVGAKEKGKDTVQEVGGVLS